MKRGCIPLSCASSALRNISLVLALALISASGAHEARSAEYGTGPWIKGYTDVLGGVLPPVPGLYVRDDAYHYEGSADRVIFNGRVNLEVDETYLADVLAISYVTPFKILGGTYAVAMIPSFVQMKVKVTAGIPAITIPVGPFDLRVPARDITALGNELAQGDTAFSPLILGWHSGNFWWNYGLFGFAPTGEYDKSSLANTSLHHWALMQRVAGTYFNPKTGFEITGAAVYSVNWENPTTDYETGNILNLEGAVTQNFGALGVGAVGYAMIQTTPDSGAGARLGSFESKVYGAGPIVTYTLGEGISALTLIAKWYAEFGAENTFEGNTVDVAATFKF
jgi:hypothetical protein